MASAYELRTLKDWQRSMLIQLVQRAIPSARLDTAELRELLGLLRDTHKIVLKYKHTRAA